MRKSVWIRILSLVLVFSLLTPVTASAVSPWNTQSTRSSYSTLFKGLLDALKKRLGDMFIPETPETPETETTIVTEPEEEPATTAASETEPAAPTTEPEAPTTEPAAPTTEPAAPTTEPEAPTTEPEAPTTEPEAPTTEPEESTEPEEVVADDPVLILLEDQSTVTGNAPLRASTYMVADESTANPLALEKNEGISTLAETSTDGTVTEGDTEYLIKYFPVTMFNYDATTINNASMAAEYAAYQKNTDPNKKPLWQSIFFGQGNAGSTKTYSYQKDTAEETYVLGRNLSAESYSTYDNGGYYLLIDGQYEEITLVTRDRDAYNNRIYTITTSGGERYIDISRDEFTALYYYTKQISDTENISGSVADWNWWTNYIDEDGNTTTTEQGHGQYAYTGLVADKLVDGQIQFNVPQGGIFDTTDTTNKDVYTNVGMPFVFDKSTGYYNFNSNEMSARFAGTPASNMNLTWNSSSQGGNFWPYDGAPGNVGNIDYHFGMIATVPFTMTPDGKMTNANKDDIQFEFSGDDDVWVFVDGTLVLDIGGVHNEIPGVINFAENTWTVGAESGAGRFVVGTEGVVSEGQITGKVFNDATGKGVLNTDITTFAATDTHYLTIYYLERGEGSSNCKIKFNLPMRDSVTVKKVVDSMMLTTTDANGKEVVTGTPTALTAAQQTVVNNMDFGFTLYNGANQPVANATYTLMNDSNQVIDTPSTDAKGHFTLKNGQTAKFIVDFEPKAETDNDSTYYVVEDVKNGFIYTTANANVVSADGYFQDESIGATAHTYAVRSDPSYVLTDMTYKSGSIAGIASNAYTVYGSDEAEDSLTFTFENFLNQSLPTPTSMPNDEQIVIDYGLPVEIDIESNDYYIGDRFKYEFITGYETVDGVTTPKYGTAESYTGEYGTFTYDGDGKIKYQLNKQLTGVECIPYLMTVYADYVQDGVAKTAEIESVAYIYIIPATTMYYEENFSNMVTYLVAGNNPGWSAVGTAQNANQEPGVVGTFNDSPYGSDVAYRDDNQDSNGTSMMVDTTDGAAQFSYTFTGTETSFFARTAADTGYMKIVIYDKDGKALNTYYRDTKFDNTGNDAIDLEVDGNSDVTLYNIPVFTWETEHHGTYTVKVTIAKAVSTANYGDKFYVDGIRVVNPLNTADTSIDFVDKAIAAYAQDAESNMVSYTLRDKMLDEATVGSGVEWAEVIKLFTDTNGEMTTAEQYQSIGPKEELYLFDGQYITFGLYDWDPNVYKGFLGMKAPTGLSTVIINDKKLTLNNSVDCYYDLAEYASIETYTETDDNGKEVEVRIAWFVIEAADKSLVSLTELKATGPKEFKLVSKIDEDIKVPGPEADGDDSGDTNIDIEVDGSESGGTDNGNSVDEELIVNAISEPAVNRIEVAEPVVGQMPVIDKKLEAK